MNTGNDSAKKISQRIVWLDIAKALGIVAIVLGHTIQGGLVKKYVYSFHVPMFFLKVYGQFYIELSACKIIGNGVTIVGDVSYPIVGVDIVDV